jgi:hypothetical protein
MRLELLTKEGELIGLADLKPFSLLNPHPAPLFFANHQDVALRDSQQKPCGLVNFTAAVSGTDKRNPRKLIEPSLQFMETSMSSLQIGQAPESSELDEWAVEAKLNGWVSERDARAIWEGIARAHGWRPPGRPNMAIETEVIGEYSPEQPRADDGFEKAIFHEVVFEQAPKCTREAPHEVYPCGGY